MRELTVMPELLDLRAVYGEDAMRPIASRIPNLALGQFGLDRQARNALAENALFQRRFLNEQAPLDRGRTKPLTATKRQRRIDAELEQIAQWVTNHWLEVERVDIERSANAARSGTGLAESVKWVEENRARVRAERCDEAEQRSWRAMLERGMPAVRVAEKAVGGSDDA